MSSLRYVYAQSKYRNNSKSDYKDGKHVAHIVSIELYYYIVAYAKGPINVDILKKAANKFTNFRMVLKNTNLSTHRVIDNNIMYSHGASYIMSKKETLRARLQAKIIQKLYKQGELSLNIYKASKKIYCNIKSYDGLCVWDRRRDPKNKI